MDIEKFTIQVDKTVCHAEIGIPDGEMIKDNLVIMLAHGRNPTMGMNEPVIKAMFEGLARWGYCTVRFNFPFAQKKKKKVDDHDVLIRTYKEVVRSVEKRHPKHIIIGGFSLGSLVAAHIARSKGDAALLLGYPLTHNKEILKEAKKIIQITKPTLIINGTEDKYTDPKEMMRVVEDMHQKGTQVQEFFIDKVAHDFKIPKNPIYSQVAVYKEMIEMIDNWIAHHGY